MDSTSNVVIVEGISILFHIDILGRLSVADLASILCAVLARVLVIIIMLMVVTMGGGLRWQDSLLSRFRRPAGGRLIGGEWLVLVHFCIVGCDGRFLYFYNCETGWIITYSIILDYLYLSFMGCADQNLRGGALYALSGGLTLMLAALSLAGSSCLNLWKFFSHF